MLKEAKKETSKLVDVDLDLTEFNTWLTGYIDFKRQPKVRESRLDTMRLLCSALGNPEKSCRCFHVTGSKGKGTISADIAAILREAGYTTGVLASPHAYHFVERVGTGAEPFPQEVYDRAFFELKETVEKLLAERKLKKEFVGWFELTTAFSMLCFRVAKVDFAVYEVGMGGKHDATNIIQPEACAFGPIELEHTRLLGDTIAKIAYEKAGIIKMHTPCVSVPQVAEARMALEEVAKSRQTNVTFVDKMDDYVLQDAEVARVTVQKVLPEIPDDVCNFATKKVHLPGRFEKIERPNGLIVIDVAHTERSILEILSRMKREGICGELLFGCADGKNVEAMAKAIADSKLFSKIHLTRPGDFKKSNIAEMVRAFHKAGIDELEADADFATFIPHVVKEAQSRRKTLVVLGSFYLVCEVGKYLERNELIRHLAR